MRFAAVALALAGSTCAVCDGLGTGALRSPRFTAAQLDDEEALMIPGAQVIAADDANLGAIPEPAVVRPEPGEVLSSCIVASACTPCESGSNVVACLATGYKQISRCTLSHNRTTDGVVTEVSRQERVYTTCAPPGAGTSQVRTFEMFMVFGAAGSLYVVAQRKKQAYQRLSNIVNS